MREAAAIDCHVHVFDPARFAYITPRRFTPGAATVADLRAHLATIGAQRAVLVQPSVYGDDNSCLLDALQALGHQARGVAVISAHTTAGELARLDAAGVCGARLNLAVEQLESAQLESAQAVLQKLQTLEACIPANWHVQLHVSPTGLAAIAAHLEKSGRVYVLDHLGLPDLSLGVSAPAWTRQLRLMQTGRLYVKLSAPYLSSHPSCHHSVAYDDLKPFVESLMAANPQRVLWGSNWPHTLGTARDPRTPFDAVEPFRTVDDRLWLALCNAAAPGQAATSRNAEQLYGFN